MIWRCNIKIAVSGVSVIHTHFRHDIYRMLLLMDEQVF